VNAHDIQDQAARDLVLQARLRLIGWSILVVGWVVAAFVAGMASGEEDATLPVSKRDNYQMEILGGKSNLLASEIREFIGSLWHGRRLAVLLALVSLASALGCLLFAHRLNYSPALRGRLKSAGPGDERP
jgi:hypothetical protein